MTFVASNGQLFRILAIEPEMDEERSAETMGLWVVEPVGDALDRHEPGRLSSGSCQSPCRGFR